MDKLIKRQIELFKKITFIHYLTDPTGCDTAYPPHFTWLNFRAKNLSLIRQHINEVTQFLKRMQEGFDLYFHFPYCHKKCSFCRQFSLACDTPSKYRLMLDLILKELGFWYSMIKKSGWNFPKAESVYLGGGTPTLFDLDKFFIRLSASFDIRNAVIHVESTPKAINSKILKILRQYNISRLSVGVQSFDKKVLKAINRYSNLGFYSFKKKYKLARRFVPFVTVELVCGLPKQSPESFLQDVKFLLKLKPDGIHVYEFLKTPLTFLNKENPDTKYSDFSLCQQMFGEAARLIRKNGYQWSGDEFCLNEGARNYQHSSVSRNRFLRLIGIGPSAAGAIYNNAKGSKYLRTLNICNLKEYERRISDRRFPLKKIYLTSKKDEIMRIWLIRSILMYDFDLETLKKNFSSKFNVNFNGYFKKEFALLDKLKSVGQHPLIYTKPFFSKKILAQCRYIINKHYKNLKYNLSFLGIYEK